MIHPKMWTRPHTFLGFPMGQNSFALPALSEVLADLQPTQIVELGTWRGGLTAFLGLYARTRPDCTVSTFDVRDRRGEYVPDLFERLGIQFVEEDILSSEKGEKVVRDGQPSLVLVDAAKPRAFKRYAAMLKPGDAIMVHDIDVPTWDPTPEISPHEITEVVSIEMLDPYKHDLMRSAAWSSWRKP